MQSSEKEKSKGLFKVLREVIRHHLILSASIAVTVIGAVAAALLPPLVLERIVDRLSAGKAVTFSLALGYFALTALIGVLDSARESLLIVFGQKITHGLRSALCEKLSHLTAEAFAKQEPGAVVSRFVGDVDTVEALFTSGIVSMFADGCKVLSIFAVICVKNSGLALVLLFLLPLLFLFTRMVQKRMLAAQLGNREAVGKVTNHVPETIRCIRTIHLLGKERYMRQVYSRCIGESYDAVEKTNFYDAVYSPVILGMNALVVAVVIVLSASGIPQIQSFFGMSVGTAVAVIAYITAVFSPLESIGMEIQTIQSAVAGVHRIDEFLAAPERWKTDETLTEEQQPCIEVKNVTFGYTKDETILQNLSFKLETGEQAVLTGRTGAGKSTVFKLLLGQYRPQAGRVLIYGKDASRLPDSVKRQLFGYVEQSFSIVPGTVMDQITLCDERISREAAVRAARTVGIHDAVAALEQGYDTMCTPSLFSKGQWQLLSIARAVAAKPKLLLLDEITANLDADTEQAVLNALKNVSEDRTVLSVSHRLYGLREGRQIVIGGAKDR